MKNSYLTNLALLVVIVIVFWFNQQSDSPQETTMSLSDIKAMSISDIIITRAQGNDIKLHKHTTGWKITQPLNADGNNTRISLLLSLLSTPIYNQLDNVDDTVLEKFGLKPIKLSLQLNNQLFVFGDVEPLSKRRYILHNNTIYLIEDQLSPLLHANAASLIDNRLFATNSKISKIQLPQLIDGELAPSASILLSKNDGDWTTNPKNYSTTNIAALITSWQQASALQVSPISSEVDQNVSVLIWLKGQAQPTEFFVHKDERSLFLINQDKHLNYQFPITLLEQLFLSTEKD